MNCKYYIIIFVATFSYIESMRDRCIIQLHGREGVWIENYRGILKYSSEEVKIQAKEGIIRILGSNLIIEYYSNEDMHVKGLIKEVHFL